jgi:hypothetical protein
MLQIILINGLNFDNFFIADWLWEHHSSDNEMKSWRNLYLNLQSDVHGY